MDESTLPFDLTMLDKMAEVAVRVGVNPSPGQQIVITAPVEALPLVRRITEVAYREGAGLVTPILSDDAVTLARYNHAAEGTFDQAPGWLWEGIAAAYRDGAARLSIYCEDPLLLDGQDSAKVARAARAHTVASAPAFDELDNINWSIVSYPARAWATRVFPDLSPDQAQARLADAIFAASRVLNDDPVAGWKTHHAALARRRDWLNAQEFAALHFRGPGTDLMMGLGDGHAWKGGASTAPNGITHSANIPTEEVFTAPHAARVNGTVRAAKPLAYQGTLITDIEARFENGEVVEIRASHGEDVLKSILETDDGARRLGEVALVPHSSPISQSGILFFNTLFDENASCHIAQGMCYADTFRPEIAADPARVASAGGNDSMIHVDWMIGRAEMDIDGITADGTIVPVFRQGEWAIRV
ncbi:MAG: aminopeptidase [Ruaniaceae bacterium]|nr:aminopeptidase [Ruaniaceae bacterium]